MIQVQSRVKINPYCSLWFGNKEGTVIDYVPDKLMPYLVKFDDLDLPYWFAHEELIEL